MSDELSLEELVRRCLDSPGYIVHVSLLTGSRDEADHATIEHHYRRYHFPIEDAKLAVQVFGKQVSAELTAMADESG